MNSEKRFALASLLLIASIIAGYAWGRFVDLVGDPPNGFTLIGLAAFVVFVVAEFLAVRIAAEEAHSSKPLSTIVITHPSIILPGALAVFCGIAMIFDVLPSNLSRIMFLAPFLIANGHFARRNNVLGVVGCCLFVAVWSAALIFNTKYRDGVVAGFFSHMRH